MEKSDFKQLIKERPKVHEKKISLARTLNFDQWQTFFEKVFNYGQFRKLPRMTVVCDFAPSSFKLKRGILPLLIKWVL